MKEEGGVPLTKALAAKLEKKVPRLPDCSPDQEKGYRLHYLFSFSVAFSGQVGRTLKAEMFHCYDAPHLARLREVKAAEEVAV